jgi:metal-responsive CopG/Arc/MetJ family transcriptional regulator
MRGPGGLIKSAAEKLMSLRGVKHGKLGLSTTGRGL